MQTYWERRRNNQEDHSPKEQIQSEAHSSLDSNVRSSGSLSNKTAPEDDIEKRPTKKNSQKENKKHPYKKVRK